jgi:hypothetical protein
MKTKIFTTVILQFIFISILNAQVTQEWVARYSGPVHTFFQGHSVALDAAGNIYVTGLATDSNFVDACATIKYNANGVLQWEQIYGTGNDYDLNNYLAVDASGNVYVSGSSVGNNSGWDFATIKYNTDGIQLWVQRYNGPDNDYDKVSGMGIDKWGNVYVTGTSYGIFHLGPKPDDYIFGWSNITIKYDSNGTQQWVRKFNESYTINFACDWAKALTVDDYGNAYVAGQSRGMDGPNGANDECVTIKYSPSGDSLWVRRYNVDNSAYCPICPLAIAVNKSGYVFVTGVCVYNNDNGSDYFTVKYNSAGHFEWAKVYNGPGSGIDQPSSIVADVNDVYVTGLSKGSNTDYDYATIKYDVSGVQQWVQRYNGPGNGLDVAYSIKMDASGYIYVTGISVRDGHTGLCDFATIKYDYFGNQKWLVRYNGIINESCGGSSLALNSSGDVFVTGVHADSLRRSFATIKYSQLPTGVCQSSSDMPENYSLSQNYPNPFNPSTSISFSLLSKSFVSLKIFDLLGKEVATIVSEEMSAGSHSRIWNAANMSSGIYFYRLQAGLYSETKKLILLK